MDKKRKNSARRGKGQKRIEDYVQPRRSERNKSTTVKDIEEKKAKIEDNEVSIVVGKEQLIRLEKELKRKPAVRRKSDETKKSKGKIQLTETEQLDLMRNFDINPNYGPCRGISRLERYERAKKFNLQPVPDDVVKKILDEHEKEDAFQHCIWDQNQLLKWHL
ncbi:DNA polymerase delta subunit 4 [Orchesella cincta]|uniref:DNA polymerase delta subunit 4 n=1 Tax=Orchesella cincta TaxID=48709 RepID=A0A1D2MQ00_ORCCI|nr:DNA polymerase delta subunit 4 [Orchesella cincta]